MLGKLLKYDLKNLFKSLLPIYGVAMVLAVLSNIMLHIADKVEALTFVSGLITVLSIILIISLIFINFILSVTDFYKKLVKDEGYLVHTLPVKKSSIVLSKIISTLVTTAISLIITVLGIIILLMSQIDIRLVYETIVSSLKGIDTLVIILMIITIVIGYICNMLNVYASIALGQMHNGNKVLYSIVYFIVTYNIMQIISTIIILILSFFTDTFSLTTNVNITDVNTINLLLILGNVLNLTFSIIFYFITVKVFDKKLNLE